MILMIKAFLLLCFICHENRAEVSKENRLWIISFDGFRWDYLQKTKLENFQWIIDNGISAKWMEPVFITKTFPTHFSMATGLYVENHGVVGNKFYDRVFQEKFKSATGAKEAKWWSRAEPMWITATKNNVRSAASYWPGSEVSYKDVFPEHYVKFDKSASVIKRIDDIIEWFKNGTRLVNFYHSEPDGKGHTFGPNFTEVIEELKKVDGILGYALHQLRANDLLESTNIVVVGDHGKEQIKDAIFVNKSQDAFDFSKIKRIESEGVLFSFELIDSMDEAAKMDYLKKLETFLGENYKLYKSREEIPERWHYRGAADRIPTYNVFSKPGYAIYEYPWYLGPPKGGDHGYDNIHSNMKPIFMAYGPDFKNKPRKVSEVHQVDLYGMAMKLLQVDKISPNNGSITRINQIISQGHVMISNQIKEMFVFTWIIVVAIKIVSQCF